MLREDLICLGIVIVGIVLFLHGSNYYNTLTGFAGLYLMVLGILLDVAIKIWERLKSRRIGQNP